MLHGGLCIIANWEDLTVRDVITRIKDNRIVLPVIQRRLVWDEEKMETLFDSLFRQNSFGSIICIEEMKGKKPLFAYRLFTVDGSNTVSFEVNNAGDNYACSY